MLKEDLEEIALGFRKGSGVAWNVLREELDRKARGHKFHGWFVRFYDAQGKPTWSNASMPQIPELDSVSGDAASRQGYRILRQKLPGNDRLASSVAVGSSQEIINLYMTRIDELVMAVFLGVLLASPLGGYLLAGRATRPLAK